MKARGDRSTGDLLDWTAPRIAAGMEVRGGALSSRIARAVGLALKGAAKDRATIAEEMSAWLGERVSRAMLDAYASEARGTHCITVERLMALVEVTGCTDLLGFIAEPFGQAVVPARYAAVIELHLIEEHERDLAARKAALVAEARRR